MVAAIIAAAALAFIVRDIYLPAPATPTAWGRFARIAPFAVVAALSLYAAWSAPQGRKAFQMDLAVSLADVGRSMTKVPHLVSIAVLFLLAVVAFGTQRLLVAFGATMLLGVAWELAQTTVVGHNARLADLAPNLTSGLLCLVVLAGLRSVLAQRKQLSGAGELPQ